MRVQIISSVARAVLERVEFAEQAYLGGDLRGGKAVGGRGEGDHRLDDVAHPRLVEIDAADAGLADLRREGELLEHVISDEALIDAAESVSKSLQYRFQSADHFGKLVQHAAAFEFPRVMDHRFDAEDALAFGIDLEGQPAAVQLEDGQIIAGSLDRDLPFGRALGAPAIFRTVLVAQDGFDGLQIQRRGAGADRGVKHLVHVPAHIEDQVSTVFDLIAGVIVREPAVLLLVIVEGKAHTAVNPTLADLAQPPYSPGFGQGGGDLRQSCGVRDSGKAISLLGEEDARSARLAGNVLMAVQDDLGGGGGGAVGLVWS